MTFKVKIILVILTASFLVLVLIWNKSNQQDKTNFSQDQINPPASTQSQTSESTSPTIVSTKPDPLEGAVVPADQIIEVAFSHPLENEPEFRRRFDPEIKYKLEMSSDRKVVKFIPEKPFELGVGYTLFILPETKFVGGGRLDGEKTFHFSTIKYRGV